MAAIKSVASILADYDSNQRFPAFGFGAKSPQFGGVSHCFPLNFNSRSPEVIGVQVSNVLTVSICIVCVCMFVCVVCAYMRTVCSSLCCVYVCVQVCSVCVCVYGINNLTKHIYVCRPIQHQ